MSNVYMIGSYSTRFQRWPDKSVKDLTKMAYIGVLQDSRVDPSDIQFLWFSNCGWGYDLPPTEKSPGLIGQMNVRGQVAFAPLVEEGLFPRRVPCVNVEGACASGSLVFHAAWKDILSGQSDLVLALGAERSYYPEHPLEVAQMFLGGVDRTELMRLNREYAELCGQVGKDWSPGHNRTLFMDTYAAQAAWHMRQWGTTREQLAIVASKNHWHGSLNPLAQYQFEVPVEKVLDDYEVSWPLSRSMCAPLGDGAAAALLCSEDYLRGLPPDVRERSIRVAGSIVAGGASRSIAEPSLSHVAAQKAYRLADVGPEEIDVAEVHDATAFCELYQSEMLGFCGPGEGGQMAASGETRCDGKRPINTSGGLESKGHPVGATGLSQINEIALQLRGEAGKRQVRGAQTGLVENGGGVVSTEEYCCGVTILKKE